MIIFNRAPTSYQEDWAIIKKILHKWHRTTTNWHEQDHRLILADLEKKARTPLPPSLKEWICLNEVMIKSGQWLLRDFHDINYRKDIDAITILIQGEEDYYWAIKRENLVYPNPPVDGYTIRYDGNTKIVRWDKPVSPGLTTFIITYLLDYHLMFEGTGGYDATIRDKDAVIQAFREELPVFLKIEDYLIFESEEILAFIQDIPGSPDKALLSVHYDGAAVNLPACVRNNFQYQGSYYGPSIVKN